MTRDLGPSIRRANEAMAEAQFTVGQAITWAEEWYRAHDHHWPVRRYRVEGSRAGKSRLVTEATGGSIASRCGGKVVELIPSRRLYCKQRGIVRVSRRVGDVEGLGVCPRCSAEPDAPCETPRGALCAPHVKRTSA